MKFIAVRSFNDYISAHIIMGRLKEEFINCHLENEHTGTTAPFLINFTDGIRLMVMESHVERALSLLQQFDRESDS